MHIPDYESIRKRHDHNSRREYKQKMEKFFIVFTEKLRQILPGKVLFSGVRYQGPHSPVAWFEVRRDHKNHGPFMTVTIEGKNALKILLFDGNVKGEKTFPTQRTALDAIAEWYEVKNGS